MHNHGNMIMCRVATVSTYTYPKGPKDPIIRYLGLG